MPSLSKSEKAFIEGKIDPNANYRRVLLHRIKKKREEIIQELQLIDSFLEKQEREK